MNTLRISASSSESSDESLDRLFKLLPSQIAKSEFGVAAQGSTCAMGWHTTMRKAKAKHRPDLEDWEGDGLFEIFPAFVNALSEDYEAFIPSKQNGGTTTDTTTKEDAKSLIPEDIPVLLDAKTLTPDQFAKDYEAAKLPCVIRSIPAGHDGGKEAPEWRAMKDWGFFALENDPELRERAFKCGEDDDGHAVKVKLKHFLRYLQNNHDDSPLYIFDSAFEDDKISKRILRKFDELTCVTRVGQLF